MTWKKYGVMALKLNFKNSRILNGSIFIKYPAVFSSVIS